MLFILILQENEETLHKRPIMLNFEKTTVVPTSTVVPPPLSNTDTTNAEMTNNPSDVLPTTTTTSSSATAAVTTSIAITTDTLILAGTGTTGTRTLAPYGMATLLKLTATSWTISGNGLT